MAPSAVPLDEPTLTTLPSSKSNIDGNGTKMDQANLPAVPVLANTASVDEVVEALKVGRDHFTHTGQHKATGVDTSSLGCRRVHHPECGRTSGLGPDGKWVAPDLTKSEQLILCQEDLRPLLEADVEWEGSFFPRETRRCYALIKNSPTFAQQVVMHPLYQAVCAKFLTTKNWFWSGHEKIVATSKPQIMNTVCFSIRPGSKQQPLHRDDWCHHVVAPRIDSYPEDLQRDMGLGLFVAGKDATFENGCTRFIPGSHLWEHEREPDDDLCAYAELRKGDAFMMFASCYHGGGANKTLDQERLLYSCFMTRGWLRQEENHYLNMSLDTVKNLPRELQDTIGWSLSEPFLGWVDVRSPRALFDAEIQVSRTFSSSHILGHNMQQGPQTLTFLGACREIRTFSKRRKPP
jgi:ectoine hydroxylase-related dioxygenase (phytanoyl-CoA dioxygenase family)